MDTFDINGRIIDHLEVTKTNSKRQSTGDCAGTIA
jgi:hypothetical protein